MKKILLLLVIASSLLIILPGCKVVGLNSCPITRTSVFQPIIPGARYLVIYQYMTPIVIREHVGRSDGTLSVPSHGQPCSSLYVTAVTNSNLSLSASPASVYLPSPPATGTVTGQSFDTTYGMPQVDYFDSNGYLAGSVYANSVTGGTSLDSNMPNLSNVYSGTYQVRVSNKTYDGYYTHIVGTATMSGWGRDRPDSDGDGWYDDEDCNPWDPSLNYDCNQNCGNDDGGLYYEQPQFEVCNY